MLRLCHPLGCHKSMRLCSAKKVFPYLDECIIINKAVILTERQGRYGEKDRSERHIGKGAER